MNNADVKRALKEFDEGSEETTSGQPSTPLSTQSQESIMKTPENMRHVIRAAKIRSRTVLPNKEQNSYGLRDKFIITRVDGKPIPDEAKFFVLRLDEGGDDAQVKASRKALMVYADEIEWYLPKLAKDLRETYGGNNV